MATTGRKPRDIGEESRQIILSLIASGESDNRVRKITRIKPERWQGLAARDRSFGKLLDRAREQRDGNLARALRESMLAQIKKGHPWWAKLAIHNYRVLLKDPDVVAAAKVKRMVEKAKAADDDANAYLETDPALAGATLPPGAMPSTGIGRPVPGGPGGPAVGQDGNRQACPGPESVGRPPEPPRVG